MSTQSKDESDSLGQDEPISAPAFQCTSNRSPSPATQRTANQSPAAATQRITNQSPAAVVTRHTSDQSSKSTPPLIVTLPKSPRNGNKARWSNYLWNKKGKGQYSIRREQHKPEKGSVPQGEDKTKKKKTNTTEEWKWEDKEKPMMKNECTLEAEVIVDLDHGITPFDIFQTVTGMNELLKIIVTETNRYAAQKVCNSETTEDEMKAFLGINSIMGINKLPSLTIGQETNVSEIKIFKTLRRKQVFSPSYIIFAFPITTMTIKLTNRTKSALLLNI